MAIICSECRGSNISYAPAEEGGIPEYCKDCKVKDETDLAELQKEALPCWSCGSSAVKVSIFGHTIEVTCECGADDWWEIWQRRTGEKE